MPREHGNVEKAQDVVQKALAFYLTDFKEDWDEVIYAIAAGMNSSPNKSTNCSPNMLVFGRELPRCVDRELKPPPNSTRKQREVFVDVLKRLDMARRVAREQSEKAKADIKVTYDKRARDREFAVGDCVFLYML